MDFFERTLNSEFNFLLFYFLPKWRSLICY